MNDRDLTYYGSRKRCVHRASEALCPRYGEGNIRALAPASFGKGLLKCHSRPDRHMSQYSQTGSYSILQGTDGQSQGQEVRATLCSLGRLWPGTSAQAVPQQKTKLKGVSTDLIEINHFCSVKGNVKGMRRLGMIGRNISKQQI